MATTAADEPLKPAKKVSRAGWYALTLVSASQALSLLDRQILSILAPMIKEDLQIGDAELGLLYGTVFALFYALFSLPLGRLVDGWIRTRLLAICVATWSISTGLAAFASTFSLLAFSRLGVGIGEAAAQPAGNSIVFDEFPREKRGTAMAAMGIATAIGLGMSMTLGGVVAQWWDGLFPEGSGPGGFSGWQFAFLVAAFPGLILAWLFYRMKEPQRGLMDGIKTEKDPHPFKSSAAVLGAVTPGSNWYMLWHRKAGTSQWVVNFTGLAIILAVCFAAVHFTQIYSPRPPILALGMAIDPHVLQWTVVALGSFVVLNLFQSFKLTDKAAYNVILSPSLIMIMVVGALQTSVNYGVMGFTPSYLNREFGLSPAETGLQFGLLSAALGIMGPILAGPLSDWLTVRMGGRGRVWLTMASLGISPFFGIWTFSAEDVMSFYLRFSVYSLILTLWLPPLYSLMYDMVLPRMRGITSSIYIIVSTLLGLGMGPYVVGIISDRSGDLGFAIKAINYNGPIIVILLLILLFRITKDENSLLARARAGGENV